MAVYEINRADHQELTPRYLLELKRAFHLLYSGAFTTDPKIILVIRGDWPDYDRDGLHLERGGAGGEIVEIGREYITIKIKQLDPRTNLPELCKVRLCPTRDTGFSVIRIMTDR